MTKDYVIPFRAGGDLEQWLRKYAQDRKWSMSQTIRELLTEKRKDIECREMIRKADSSGQTTQHFMTLQARRAERKREETVLEGRKFDAIQAAQDEADEHDTQAGAIASY